MGNSGVATVNSSAASYYNPSLLRQRPDNSFSLTGNTLGTSTARQDGSNVSSSMAFGPSFLSTILVGTNLVHELFLATTMQGQFTWLSEPNAVRSFDGDINVNRVVSGYSMAFKAIPLALQVLTRYTEVKSFLVSEYSDTATGMESATKTRTEFKNLNVALGISTHFQFDHYTLGINFNTRGIGLYNLNKGSSRSYIHTPSGYTVRDSDLGSAVVTNEEGKLIIGHGFRLGDHELLTDSTFFEQSGNLDRYQFTQSFGYRYGPQEGHQVLCGVAHAFGSDVDYFGQSFITSVGYSWKSRTLRSAIGLYYSRQNTNVESSNLGFLFGGEYEY
ncbi:MAG TPA: hypothetical protein VGE46_10630 [Bdellovibrio sp.]